MMMISILRCITLTAFLGLATSFPAKASDFAEYSYASQRFAKLVATAALDRKVPRISDPATEKLLSILSNHHRFLESRAFTSGEMGNLIDMCGSANQAATSFVLFDLQKHLDKSTKDPVEIAKITFQVASRNSVAYQDEITPLLAFHYRCLAKEVPLISAFAAALPQAEFTSVRRDGLVQVRRGVFTSFISMVRMATEPAISLRNRREMFTVMAEVAPIFAQVLDLGSRKRAHDYFDSMASVIPSDLRGEYRQIALELAAVQCKGLCRL